MNINERTRYGPLRGRKAVKRKSRTILRIGIFCGFALVPWAESQSPAAPTTDLYEITSGRYTEVGGFVGVLEYGLPDSYQAFVELKTDPVSNTANMRILGVDLAPWGPYFDWPLVEGTIDGNTIVFSSSDPWLFGEPGSLSYAVLLRDGGLTLDGVVAFEPQCCDIPSLFEHSDVQASLIPEPTTGLLLTIACWWAFTRRLAFRQDDRRCSVKLTIVRS